MPVAPAIQNAVNVLEAELKHRIHAAALKASVMVEDVKAIVEKTDEELSKAYDALRASMGLTMQEEQQAQSRLAMAATKAQGEAIAKAAAEAAKNQAPTVVVDGAGGTLTLVPPGASDQS
jgi:hypothetical protein